MTGTAGTRRLSRNRSPVRNPGSCARAGGSRRWRPSPPTNLGAQPLRPTGRRTSSCPQPTGRRCRPGADDLRGGRPNARALSRRCRRLQSLATMVRHLGSGKTNWFLRHARSATGTPVSAFRQICSFSASEPKRRRRRYPSVARLEKRKYCLLRDGNSDAVERVDVEVSRLSLVGQAAELGAVSV